MRTAVLPTAFILSLSVALANTVSRKNGPRALISSDVTGLEESLTQLAAAEGSPLAPSCPRLSTQTCEQLGESWQLISKHPGVCGATPLAKKNKRGGWAKCKHSNTFEQGVRMCADLGARLCTIEELMDGVPAFTGCQFEAKRVWTSSQCGEGRVWTAAGGPKKLKKRPKKCTRAKGKQRVRCCADETLATPTPTPPTPTPPTPTPPTPTPQNPCEIWPWRPECLTPTPTATPVPPTPTSTPTGAPSTPTPTASPTPLPTPTPVILVKDYEYLSEQEEEIEEGEDQAEEEEEQPVEEEELPTGCPFEYQCGGRNQGICVDGICSCTKYWKGKNCSIPVPVKYKSLGGFCKQPKMFPALSGVVEQEYHHTNFYEGPVCQMLIQPTGGVFGHIELKVNQLAISSGFDLIQVIDGSKLSDPVIANITNNDLWEGGFFSTGKAMLVAFSSSKVNVTSTFSMSYSTHNCPFSCSGHGHCTPMGRCTCDMNPLRFRGEFCSVSDAMMKQPTHCLGNTDHVETGLMVGLDEQHPSVIKHGVVARGWEVNTRIELFTPPTVDKNIDEIEFFFWLDKLLSPGEYMTKQQFITFQPPAIIYDPQLLKITTTGSMMQHLALGPHASKSLKLHFSCAADLPETESEDPIPVKVILPLQNGCEAVFKFLKTC